MHNEKDGLQNIFWDYPNLNWQIWAAYDQRSILPQIGNRGIEKLKDYETFTSIFIYIFIYMKNWIYEL